MKKLLLLATHLAALALGFALGIYALPILIAPAPPSAAEVQSQAALARYTGSFRARDILGDWEASRGKFVKIMPTEYRRALGEMWRAANPQQLAA